ncbi:pectinesterase family protein [Streptomyces canus]|uniref:pectinesterase family protein n=1 Tax=Streptomyces canus TaxID=58343 RepID=UPI0033AFF525
MTSTEQGGLSRRSFLGAATVVSAVVGGGLGMVLAAAPNAAAAQGAGVTWRISSEAKEARKGYSDMLNALRQQVGGRVESLGGPPVDVTDIAGGNSYVYVDLHQEGTYSFIRLFIRRSDSYLMGWRWGTEDIDDSDIIYWPSDNTRSFFTLDPSVAPTLADGSLNPNRLPGSTAQNTNTRFQNLGTYGNLAQQQATRDNLQLSPATFNTAVARLINGENTETRQAAQSILQLIVGVAEASRFREQARETAVAFGRGVAFALTAQHIAFHNNWSRLSRAFLLAVMAGTAVFAAPVTIAGIVIGTAAVAATYLMTAHHSDIDTRGKHVLEGSLLYVSQDYTGDHDTVQAAIDAIRSSGAGGNTILIEKGTYNEVISIPSTTTWLTLKGITGNAADVVIAYDRAHGMINPDTGLKYSTQGSAVATFRPSDLRVQDLTIQNTFSPAAHPEIDPFETQAVALAAMGDRQIYSNVRLLGRQDTVLSKAIEPTERSRQYFRACYIEGSIDFIFGNGTAVIDRSKIAMQNWVGGTILAPNTDYRRKYGILITHSEIFTNGVPEKTMYLGRPWHNVPEAWPQAVVRDTVIHSGIKAEQPWTAMVPEYPWDWARFKEYNNTGAGAGTGTNAPQLTAAEAAEYTAEKYLADIDNWTPVS